MTNTATPQFDWTPMAEDRRLYITKPAMVHEFRPLPVEDHRCTLEYRRVDGRTLRREIVIQSVRQTPTPAVIVAAHEPGASRDDIAEYRVHRMIALTGSDGIRIPPLDYLREKLGIWIE